MSPAIPTITALHALVTKLVESIQDRKFAGELRDVQRLVGALQSEHFAIQQESFELKAKNSELEKSVALFTQRVAESDAKALADAKRIEELVAQVGSLRVANEEWSRRFQEGGTGGGWGSDEDEYTTPPRG